MSKPTAYEFCKYVLRLPLNLAQGTLVKACYGLDLDAEEREIFRECTQRDVYPTKPFSEVTINSATRTGKSMIGSACMLYNCLFEDYNLGLGERGIGLLIASDSVQVKISHGYIEGYLLSSPELQNMVAELLKTEITLTNGLKIKSFPCSKSAVSGWTVVSAYLDETSAWRIEGSSDADFQIQSFIKRGMLSLNNAMLFKTSTPERMTGILFNDFKESYGNSEDTNRLYWKSDIFTMRGDLDEEELDTIRRTDPRAWEYLYAGGWMDPSDSFLHSEKVESAISRGTSNYTQPKEATLTWSIDASSGKEDAFVLTGMFLADNRSVDTPKEVGGYPESS